MPEIKWVGSPNFYPDRKDKDGVVHNALVIVNHIECGTEDGTVSWFKNPASQVSSNFGVARDGTIHQFVKLSDAAWANGGLNNPDQIWLTKFPAVNPNYWTVSIEHEGYPNDGLTESQYQSTLWLHRYLNQTLGIPLDTDHVVGHNKFDSVTRKDCPGPKFPWDRLFNDLRKGGTMNTLEIGAKGPEVVTLQKLLNAHGANPPLDEDGDFGPKTYAAVRMFQHNAKLADDGIVGPLTWAALEATVAPAPPVTHNYQLVVDVADKGIPGEFVPLTIYTMDGDKPAPHQEISLSIYSEHDQVGIFTGDDGAYYNPVKLTEPGTLSPKAEWTDPSGQAHAVVKTVVFETPASTPTPIPADDDVVVSIPAEIINDTVLFKIQTEDGQDVAVQLDTGAYELLLNKEAAAALKLVNMGAIQVTGVTGASDAYVSEASFKINGVEFKNVPCVVDDSFTGLPLFGYRFFEDNHYDLLVSEQHNTVTILKAKETN